MNYKTFTVAAVTTLGLALIAVAADEKKQLDPKKLPAPSSKANVTYASDIKGIFDASCIKCHKGEKAKGKLDLETLAGALKGGKEGSDIVPGSSEKSTLVYAVAHVGDEDDFMPPPKNKAGIKQLTEEQVGLIRTWIDQGAK